MKTLREDFGLEPKEKTQREKNVVFSLIYDVQIQNQVENEIWKQSLNPKSSGMRPRLDFEIWNSWNIQESDREVHGW